MRSHGFSYHFKVYAPAIDFHRISQYTTGKVKRDVAIECGGMRIERHDYSFYFTNAVGNVRCYKFTHFSRYIESVLLGFELKNVATQLNVGLIKLYRHTPFET